MNELNVIMLGPTLAQKGGIATVENSILQSISPQVKIHHISTHEDSSTLRKIIVFARAMVELPISLLQRNPDLIHSHFAERGSVFRDMILTLISLAFRKPVILHAHGSEFKQFYANLPALLKKILGLVFRQSTRTIVLSESWKDYYISTLQLTEKQVVVLPNAIELPEEIGDKAAEDQGYRPITFIFLGRMGQRKGVFDLVTAFSQISPELKAKTKLILAGDGEVEKVRQLVKNLNLTEITTIFDWVDTQQRNALLKQADAFVLPSYNEGLPMALLEAMSWGLPAIATPVGGIPEVVKSYQNGLLVNPGDIEQLSAAIVSLVEDETLRLFLGKMARKDVEPFDIKKYCESLTEIYRTVVSESKVS